MDYPEFDAARRRIIRQWGRELTDPEELASAVDRLRAQAATIADQADRAKAVRYLATLDDLVAEAHAPESETLRRASDVLLAALQPVGTPAERRARAEAGIAEITRIADAAPTAGERDAALELNESLAEVIAVLDQGPVD